MGEMTLFGGNNPLVNNDLFKALQEMNKTLAGGGMGGGKRISIKGGRFRLFEGGEQISVSKDDSMNIVVVNAAAVSRTYYEGTYDPNNPSAPACWSADTRTPSPDVPADKRKAASCAACPMNIKGSGQGDSRACRFNQRLAITLEGKPDEVYQLQLPATSIFGQADGNKLPLQAYAKYLAEHKTPIQAVVTSMYFDENSETPKLFFKPARMVNAEETAALLEHVDGEEVKKAITFTVSAGDREQQKKPAPDKAKVVGKAAGFTIEEPEEEAPAPKAKAAPVDADEDDVEEPKVAAKKAKAEPAKKEALSDLMSGWDD